MKVMYKYSSRHTTGYRPYSENDSGITITASSSHASFPSSNLKYKDPTRAWKSNNVITESWVKYYFGSTAVSHTGLFLNRINFAAFDVYISNDDITYTKIEEVSGITRDEIEDENYMHYFVDLGTVSFKYLKVVIPAQIPLFDNTYFKIGNMYVGTYTEVWNPKSGFRIAYIPKISDIEYDSGYVNRYVLGRTKRSFTGSWDKVAAATFDLAKTTYSEIVLFLDMFSDNTKAYLVRPMKDETSFDIERPDIKSKSFTFEEIV